MSNEAILEVGLEEEICTYLGDHGWTYVDGTSDAGWDMRLALYPEDLLSWLEKQYPDEYYKVIPDKLVGEDRKQAQKTLLEALATELDKKPVVNRKTGQSTGGLMGVLHNGFNYLRVGRATAKFGAMVAFPPDDPMIRSAVKRAHENILRVIRQVHFDTERSKATIDLVFLVNGIPVATAELKTDATQTIADALRQYKVDRVPTATSRLLKPGRCLVHFAVSDWEVFMTTKLRGEKTRFLPFNRGTKAGRQGNDPVDDGVATSYLWRDVLEREQFLCILNSFAFFEPDNKKKVGSDGTLIFPRFHQLRAVERVMADISDKGPGQSYLIWHSAGSGKTKTIAWLAHRLIKHVSNDGEPTFDSVILVSDRTVLDRNLRESVQMLRAANGLVVPIERKGKAKSEALDEALNEGNSIITCTLQTFPEVLKRIESREDLEGRRWAVIADEAHTSQTGKTANALRELLADQIDFDEDEDEIAGDDLLSLNQRRVSNAANMTFIAFTATPKPKTLRLFGTHDEEHNVWHAFDTYTMAQAIDERFILDVLTNYSTYEMLGEVAAKSEEDEVELRKAVSDVYKYVRLHPTAISQKVQIVIEHFKTNVLGELDGQARAMVVTSSRAEAVRWAKEMNRYIEQKGYAKLFKALVAFSGTVTMDSKDRELKKSQTRKKNEVYTEYTEASMNGDGDVETKFKDDDADYRVMIVANKFQTGFNEPRLVAMYVDKKLNGVATVQTLSRLNRTYAGKTKTMIVDFVNDTASILADFEMFYQDAVITQDVDPLILGELGVALDAAAYYDESDMEKITQATLAGKESNHSDFVVPLQKIARAWLDDLIEARRTGDEEMEAEVKLFRKRVRKYVSAWEFLTQILDYRDVTIHRRALLLSHLRRFLVDNESATGMDYTGLVDLQGLSMQPAQIEQSLGLTDEGTSEMNPPDWEVVDGGQAALELGPLEEVVERVNELLGQSGSDVERSQVAGFISTFWTAAKSDESLKAMISDNTPDQLRNSAAVGHEFLSLLWRLRNASEEISNLVMFDDEGRKLFAEQMLEQLIREKEEGNWE